MVERLVNWSVNKKYYGEDCNLVLLGGVGADDSSEAGIVETINARIRKAEAIVQEAYWKIEYMNSEGYGGGKVEDIFVYWKGYLEVVKKCIRESEGKVDIYGLRDRVVGVIHGYELENSEE